MIDHRMIGGFFIFNLIAFGIYRIFRMLNRELKSPQKCPHCGGDV